MGAVPFQEAKCALVGNRVMSPISTSSRAAPEGPMPCRLSRVVPVASTDPLLVVEPGGQRYFEPSKPLLSLSLPLATPGPRRPNESHTTSVGSRCESDSPGAWTEPCQAPVLGQWNK